MEATRTYLELTTPDQFRSAFGHFPEIDIERVARPTPELYRHCYRTVGEAYHWRDRWDWTDAEIRAHLAQREIILYVARRHGALAGWYELRRVPEDGSVEIAYFGLLARHRPGPRQASPLLRSARRLDPRTLARVAAYLHARSSGRAAKLPEAGVSGVQD